MNPTELQEILAQHQVTAHRQRRVRNHEDIRVISIPQVPSPEADLFRPCLVVRDPVPALLLGNGVVMELGDMQRGVGRWNPRNRLERRGPSCGWNLRRRRPRARRGLPRKPSRNPLHKLEPRFRNRDEVNRIAPAIDRMALYAGSSPKRALGRSPQCWVKRREDASFSDIRRRRRVRFGSRVMSLVPTARDASIRAAQRGLSRAGRRQGHDVSALGLHVYPAIAEVTALAVIVPIERSPVLEEVLSRRVRPQR